MKHYILLAKNADGKSAYIDDVPNGKKCGCFCLECGGELVAKNKGKIKVHHFAHASGNDSIHCSQTALHRMAKEIIAAEKMIPIPKNGKIEFCKAEKIELEKSLGDIKPDVLAVCDNKEIAVEIFVRHAIGDDKYRKIEARKLTTFEIDLSKLEYKNKEDVKRAIYDSANLRLIYDEEIMKNPIETKRQLIKLYGVLKSIKNGIVEKCPMNGIVFRNYIYWRNVRSSFCKQCFLSCESEKHDELYCIGNWQGKLPFWFLATNVHENRIMSNEETVAMVKNFKRSLSNSIL